MRYDSCRQCTKRRIKCDKATPRCAKCVKKGLECSGIGKTYQFVQNTTPQTIETSSSKRRRHTEPRRDEIDAPNDVSSTATFSNSPSSGDGSIEFIVDEDGDVDAIMPSQSGIQRPINGIVMHLPRHQTFPGATVANTAQYPLDYAVALYKPGQVMLLDHCKLKLSCPSEIMFCPCSSHTTKTEMRF